MAAKSRTVLVTGGAGFIGSHLVDALIERGLRVRILDNISTGTRSNLNPGAELIEADLRNLDSIRPAFHDTDTATYTAEDFRFTTKGNTLYAIELGKPSGRETVIRSLSSNAEGTPKVDSVTLLGVDGMLTFHQQPDGLHIELPTVIRDKYAYAFRILPVSAAQ